MATRISQLRFKRSIIQDLRSMGATVDRELASLTRILSFNPEAGERLKSGVKGEEVPLWRLRLGPYRVTYTFGEDHVWVLVIAEHRWGSGTPG